MIDGGERPVPWSVSGRCHYHMEMRGKNEGEKLRKIGENVSAVFVRSTGQVRLSPHCSPHDDKSKDSLSSCNMTVTTWFYRV